MATSWMKLRKGGGRPSSRKVLTDQQRAFCSAYVRTGSAYGAAVYAGYHPASGYRLLENPAIQAQIRKLQEQAEKCEERRAEKTFAIDREFLDSNLAHFVVNGETHPVRGDADKVKAIELGYKTLGIIQPSQVVNQAVASDSCNYCRRRLRDVKRNSFRCFSHRFFVCGSGLRLRLSRTVLGNAQ